MRFADSPASPFIYPGVECPGTGGISVKLGAPLGLGRQDASNNFLAMQNIEPMMVSEVALVAVDTISVGIFTHHGIPADYLQYPELKPYGRWVGLLAAGISGEQLVLWSTRNATSLAMAGLTLNVASGGYKVAQGVSAAEIAGQGMMRMRILRSIEYAEEVPNQYPKIYLPKD